jgi:hypothetical protein
MLQDHCTHAHIRFHARPPPRGRGRGRSFVRSFVRPDEAGWAHPPASGPGVHLFDSS